MQIENSKLKIALVHDYLREYGGAERVLEALCEIFPDAPIYTAFYREDSEAYKRLKHREIHVSWAHHIPFFATKLHSPLRFLAPLIWGSWNFSSYDAVITSAGWYITKGVTGNKKHVKSKPIEICYCHTPPRWLYGYKTSLEWQKYLPVRVYAAIVGHFMRMYDFKAAQRVDYFIANSENTKKRIAKFYRKDATVIYPPVWLLQVGEVKKGDYYLTVSRIVGTKGLDLAIEAANRLGIKLKVVGTSSGYDSSQNRLTKKASPHVEFLGFVSDEELAKLYKGAKAFLALAEDEDFGITPVEAMLCGTPVIAYKGGGYLETVVEEKTGVFFEEPTVESLTSAIKRFEKMKIKEKDCVKQAQKFSKERFREQIHAFLRKVESNNA